MGGMFGGGPKTPKLSTVDTSSIEKPLGESRARAIQYRNEQGDRIRTGIDEIRSGAQQGAESSGVISQMLGNAGMGVVRTAGDVYNPMLGQAQQAAARMVSPEVLREREAMYKAQIMQEFNTMRREAMTNLSAFGVAPGALQGPGSLDAGAHARAAARAQAAADEGAMNQRAKALDAYSNILKPASAAAQLAQQQANLVNTSQRARNTAEMQQQGLRSALQGNELGWQTGASGASNVMLGAKTGQMGGIVSNMNAQADAIATNWDDRATQIGGYLTTAAGAAGKLKDRWDVYQAGKQARQVELGSQLDAGAQLGSGERYT